MRSFFFFFFSSRRRHTRCLSDWSSDVCSSDLCERCGLDYSFADAADGPAVFVIMISGFIVVFAALGVEFAYQPPYWVHAALWLPLIALTTLGPLRPIKGLMIALQYHHKAAEGRLSGSE